MSTNELCQRQSRLQLKVGLPQVPLETCTGRKPVECRRQSNLLIGQAENYMISPVLDDWLDHWVQHGLALHSIFP